MTCIDSYPALKVLMAHRLRETEPSRYRDCFRIESRIAGRDLAAYQF